MADYLRKNTGKYRGSDSPIQYLSRQSKQNEAPALTQQVTEEVDWPDAVPVEILPHPTQIMTTTDIQTYLDHHNTYQESQNIHKSTQRDYWTWMMTGTTGT